MPITVGSCLHDLSDTETIDLSIDGSTTISDLLECKRDLSRALSGVNIRSTVRVQFEDGCDGAELKIDLDPRESCRVLVTPKQVEEFVDCFSPFLRHSWSRSEFLSLVCDSSL